MATAIDYFSVHATKIFFLGNVEYLISGWGKNSVYSIRTTKWFPFVWLFVVALSPSFAFASQSLSLLSNSRYVHVQDLSCIDDYFSENSVRANWEVVLNEAFDKCLVMDKSPALSLEVLRLASRGISDRSRILEMAIHNVKTRYAVTFIFLEGYCRPISVKECAWEEALGIRSRRMSNE